MARNQLNLLDPGNETEDTARRIRRGDTVSYTASLITQGKHRFYTLSMPSDILAETATIDTREEKPLDGFQRLLDERRAQEIADYIDSGFGTIPTAIILSAQPEAKLEYRRGTRTLSFRKGPRAFLILDGQHRVFGFQRATTRLRVPVVIYNDLRKSEEVTLFMDINTKQRPVPNELLLDIKRLAETETDEEALLRDVFDLFHKDPKSPLLGLMSPARRVRKKISRVTFNAALNAIWRTFAGADAAYIYQALGNYLHSWVAGLRRHNAADNMTNPTLFRAIILLFPTVAERVSDRHSGAYTAEHFSDVLAPFFSRVRKNDLKHPGSSPFALHETFRRVLQSGFSLSKRPQ
jgi:DGQHR domain-containing protein